METKVETFELNEHLEDHLEINAEQLKLIEDLGLDGQKTLIGESKNETLCMYPEVTRDQSFIIKTLCPKRYKVQEYRRMQIPLRVMQVIAHVKQEVYFNHLYIFDKNNEVIKDPFLLGCKGEYYNGTYFLLARWGEELLSWRELSLEAVNVWRERKKALVEEFIEDLRRYSINDKGESFSKSIEIPSLTDWN